MQEFTFESPSTLAEVCRSLAGGGRLIAGGTDVIPQMEAGRFKADRLIDLSRLAELRYIQWKNGLMVIGALTRYSEMVASPLLQKAAPLLVQAAAEVGAVQTRNRGTLGGNIANASPAGDTLPPLLALNAAVTLVNAAGERVLPLADLLQGPGQTALAPDEVIHSVTFHPLPAGTTSVFLKLGNRQGMAIALASAAVVLRLGPGERVEDVRIALGAVAPTPVRCPRAEVLLVGQALTDDQINRATALAVQECSPIDDVRSSAGYRRHAVKVLVRRGLLIAAGRRER